MHAVLAAALLTATSAKIKRVEVRAVGITPQIGGPLATPAAKRALNQRPKRAIKRGATQLGQDASRWFGSRGYVVEGVDVSVRPIGDDAEAVLLSARVLPCGGVRVASNSTRRVLTRPGTIARRLGLRKGRPFRWDPTKLAALTDPQQGGLFLRDGTRAKATVENHRVVVDVVAAEPAFASLAPEVEVDADRVKVALKAEHRNVLGLGYVADVDVKYSRLDEAPTLACSLASRPPGGRAWAWRLRPFGPRAASVNVDGLRAYGSVDVEEVPGGGDDKIAFPGVAATTVGWRGARAAWRVVAGDRQGSKFAGSFGKVGVAGRASLKLPKFLNVESEVRAEPYAAVGAGKPLADSSRPEAVAAPGQFERAPWDGRKDALADAFDGGLAGGRIEVRAPLPQSPACTAVLFADAAVATDWAANAPAADAAYGVAFQANVLRVDVTKRLGAFQQRAKLSLTIENPFKGLRCP